MRGALLARFISDEREHRTELTGDKQTQGPRARNGLAETSIRPTERQWKTLDF